MNHTMSSTIEKLMYWRSSAWVRHDLKATNLTLRVHFDQLLITGDDKIIESLNMTGRFMKIKGIYKEDVLILIVSKSGLASEVRKIKFQVKGDFTRVFQTLGEHFPVVSHGHAQSAGNKVISCRYRNLDEVLRCALERMDLADSTTTPMLLQDYSDFVKTCLLDPTFPNFVLETQNILENEILKK